MNIVYISTLTILFVVLVVSFIVLFYPKFRLFGSIFFVLALLGIIIVTILIIVYPSIFNAYNLSPPIPHNIYPQPKPIYPQPINLQKPIIPKNGDKVIIVDQQLNQYLVNTTCSVQTEYISTPVFGISDKPYIWEIYVTKNGYQIRDPNTKLFVSSYHPPTIIYNIPVINSLHTDPSTYFGFNIQNDGYTIKISDQNHNYLYQELTQSFCTNSKNVLNPIYYFVSSTNSTSSFAFFNAEN